MVEGVGVLEGMMDGLSDAGRYAVVDQHAGRIAFSDGVLDAAIAFFEENDPYRAAGIAKRTDRPMRAIEIYERHGSIISAAEVALEAGLKDESDELYQRVIDHYVDGGLITSAIHAAEKAGLTERASELYRSLMDEYEASGNSKIQNNIIFKARQDFEKAAEYAGKLGLYERKMEFHERAGNNLEAARVARRLGLTNIADDLYESEIAKYDDEMRFTSAANIAYEAGMPGRTIGIYEKYGLIEIAASKAREFGLDERANQLFKRVIEKHEQAGNFEGAARVAHIAGWDNLSNYYTVLESKINELGKGFNRQLRLPMD